MPKTVSYSSIGQGIALVTINNPPVNAYGAQVAKDLVTTFNQIYANSEFRGIVLRGHNRNFMAGADISHLMKNQSAPTDKPMRAFIKECNSFLLTIESNEKPCVAAVEGFALGGGCELAMACSARIGAPTTVMGLPELLLGLIPGFGGTQRLPRLVGLEKATDMMLRSKPIVGGSSLLKSGLIDALNQDGDVVGHAREYCLKIINGQIPHNRTMFNDSRLFGSLKNKKNAIAFLDQVEKKLEKKIGKTQIHPYACINSLRAAILQGGVQGLIAEGKYFMEIGRLPQAKALCHVFFASRKTSKVPDLKGLRPRKFKSAAVIGGGVMGSGIVVSMLLAGMTVRLKEINQKMLDVGRNRIEKILQGQVKRQRLSQAKYSNCIQRMIYQLDYADFDKLDCVVEAVIEVPKLKQLIFGQLEKVTNPTCLLASNTSTINFDIICQNLQPETQKRVIGLHFFNPPHIMKLLEIIRHSRSSPQSVCDGLGLAKQLKKTPVVVGNCTGFAVNRMYFPFFQAGYLLADLGISPINIDRALKKVGIPMGVFQLADLVGLDICKHVNDAFERDFSDRSYVSEFLPLLVEKQRFGLKNKRPIYGSKTSLHPESLALLTQSRQALFQKIGKQLTASNFSDEDIALACLLPVVNESCRVLEEKIAVRSSDLDIASIFGYGFPPYQGGLMHWANSIGADYCYKKLIWLSKQFEGRFESFFKPCGYLERKAFDNSPM